MLIKFTNICGKASLTEISFFTLFVFFYIYMYFREKKNMSNIYKKNKFIKCKNSLRQKLLTAEQLYFL